MSKPINVSDLNSNYQENIERWALELSNSSRRLNVFEALYRGRRQSKTVSEIAKAANLPEQAVRDAGHQLRALGLCGHEESKAKGDRVFLYTRLAHISSIRDRIVRLARNPSRIAKLPTKRKVLISKGSVVNFSKLSPGKHFRSLTQSKRSRGSKAPKANLKIVFLATNPDADIRTDIEMRDIFYAVRRTTFRESVVLKHVPAARLSDLLSELNEFRPDVVHFSGHGGGEAIVFEDETQRSGGAVIDYDIVASFIDATDTPPKLLVLNACSTYDGADVFLESVEVVIAMLDVIDDSAAGYFATQFYSAICEGQSIGSALKQGKAVLKAGGFPDAELPKAFVRTGLDLATYKLLG
ncbi:CHAT domain-containing protein [Mesorhizobium sp. B4-1-3]|uniref:CHAT domain-containing protein n=1 Tax=Mesorhizobium sp. B4-1-3 TaxID=2589889 RepID=UPI001126FAF6|nr:CHAT domain-containing protein [Mesorhizobium sp. B4-1-3]TPI13777.1 CHAT domain-containing protein [Mesorhizobium sp. B4-1-3]